MLTCGTCERTARRTIANTSATVTPRTRGTVTASSSLSCQDFIKPPSSLDGLHAISALWLAAPQTPVVISVTFPTATVQSWDSDAECLIQQSSPTSHLLLETSTTVGSGRLYAKLGELLQNGKDFVKDLNISSTVWKSVCSVFKKPVFLEKNQWKNEKIYISFLLNVYKLVWIVVYQIFKSMQYVK